MGKKYVKLGDVNRKAFCPHCEKQFSGNYKNVDKQMEMHLKYKHGVEELGTNAVYANVQKDVVDNKYINSNFEDFNDIVKFIMKTDS